MTLNKSFHLAENSNKSEDKIFEKLKLALQWNRSDIAKSIITTTEIKFTDEQLSDLFMLALQYNHVDFVELLLEMGLKMENFYNSDRLKILYNISLVNFQ